MLSLMVSIIVSFIVTFLITPYLMKFLYVSGIVGLDLHKKDKPKLPTSGGISVAFGILAGLLTYIAIQTFIYGIQTNIISLLAVISTILIATFIGLLDDLNVKSKKINIKDNLDIRFGLPQWIKPLLTLPAAIPLMVIMSGETNMLIPFLGIVNFGILYPLLLIPIGVVACSNMINLLGGFNGVEAGMGIVYMSSLGIYALLHGNISAVIFLSSATALVGFIKFNWLPARILPGDSLTYLLGSLVGAGVIVGNMEKVGIIVMTPFIIEFFLKLRSKFKTSCLGKLREDGKLDPPYDKRIYSLTHLIMNFKKLREEEVTLILISIQIFFSFLIFMI